MDPVADYTIRQLSEVDAHEARQLRIEAFRLHPTEFRSSASDKQNGSLASLKSRITQGYVVGAFRHGQMIGMAGFTRFTGSKQSHKGQMWGMYVQPSHRGIGIGGSLLNEIVKFAKQHVECLLLTVVSTNSSAGRLYERWNFHRYGLETQAIKIADLEYLDLALMALVLP